VAAYLGSWPMFYVPSWPINFYSCNLHAAHRPPVTPCALYTAKCESALDAESPTHTTKKSDDSKQPIYECPPTKYTAERKLQILLDPKVPDEKICKDKPSGTCYGFCEGNLISRISTRGLIFGIARVSQHMYPAYANPGHVRVPSITGPCSLTEDIQLKFKR
jgi:hypothetical protein